MLEQASARDPWASRAAHQRDLDWSRPGKTGMVLGANSTKSRAPSCLSLAELQESPVHLCVEMN